MSSRSITDVLAVELEPGEAVLWRQQAPPLWLALGKMYGLFFAVAWAIFSWFWTGVVGVGYAVQGWKEPVAISFHIVTVLAIGVGALFAYIGAVWVWRGVRDLIDSWSTHYVLTDKRFFTVEGGEPMNAVTDVGRELSLDWWGRRLHIGYVQLIGVKDKAEFVKLVDRYFPPAEPEEDEMAEEDAS